MISSLTNARSRWSLSSRRSSRASSSWLTSAAAVVNATVNLFWQAARPSARATRVAVAQRNDVLAAQDIFAAGELEHDHLVEPGDGGEVERVEALYGREPSCADAPFHRPAFAVDQFELEQPQQITRMVDAIAGAFAGYLVVFEQYHRQFQLLEVMGRQYLWRAAGRARRYRVVHRRVGPAAILGTSAA